MHLDAYSLGTDTVSSDLVSQATRIILEGWDTAMVRRWAYVLEHAPHVLWIGDGYTSPPAGVGTIIKRPYTTARLVEALEPHKQVEIPTILELDGCTVDLERHQILKAGVTTSLTQQRNTPSSIFRAPYRRVITREMTYTSMFGTHTAKRADARQHSQYCDYETKLNETLKNQPTSSLYVALDIDGKWVRPLLYHPHSLQSTKNQTLNCGHTQPLL